MAEAQTVVTKRKSLDDIIDIVYLNRDNAKFEKKNEFLTLKAKIKNAEGVEEEKEFPRLYLHRAFPFDEPFSYISVLDKEQKEIGLIRSIDDFDGDTKNLLCDELTRKYYAPKVIKILTVKERYGFSYWKVLTDIGELNFTLRDTYRSLLRVGSGRVFIIDIDGNRYEIPDLEKLEFKSYKKIELYL